MDHAATCGARSAGRGGSSCGELRRCGSGSTAPPPRASRHSLIVGRAGARHRAGRRSTSPIGRRQRDVPEPPDGPATGRRRRPPAAPCRRHCWWSASGRLHRHRPGLARVQHAVQQHLALLLPHLHPAAIFRAQHHAGSRPARAPRPGPAARWRPARARAPGWAAAATGVATGAPVARAASPRQDGGHLRRLGLHGRRHGGQPVGWRRHGLLRFGLVAAGIAVPADIRPAGDHACPAAPPPPRARRAAAPGRESSAPACG